MKSEGIFPPDAQPRSWLFARAAQRAILLVLLALTRIAFSTELPRDAPARAVLSVKWQGEDTKPQMYRMQDLEKLPKKEIVTTLPTILGSSRRSRWEGVSIKYLLGLTGITPYASIRLTALNDYSVDIPLDDIQRYDPILAYRRDGKLMSVREKGPLIVIYPFDKFPALQDQQHVNRTVWQVHELVVRQ